MLLSVDGILSAGMIGAISADSLSVYMTGMAPEQVEHRPGILMNLAAIQHAIDHGCKEYDLMRGDEEYKLRLGAKPVSQYVWTASAPDYCLA